MSAILNFLNAHNSIFQMILMKLVSKSMVYRNPSYKTYIFLGLGSPLSITLLESLFDFLGDDIKFNHFLLSEKLYQ